MKRILIPVGCRSDEGLSAPIIKRLQAQDWCKVYICKLEAQDYMASYQKMDYLCRAEKHIGNHNAEKPDLVFITGDRVEMVAAAQAAFMNNVPVAHFYAGIVNNPVTTYDDILRHQITLVSDIQFVESIDAEWVVWDLMYAVGLKSNTHVVGISHLDDLEVDESKVPFIMENGAPLCDIRYDLILYNTPTKLNTSPVYNLESEINQIMALSSNTYSILIEGNPDGKTDGYLLEWVDEYYQSLPRAQFLGLLKNCQRFITNSSAAIYEAPHFLKPEQIIMVGDRNKNRPRGPFDTGASGKIVGILKEYLK